MLLPETTKRLQTKTINGQTIPEDGFCYNFGFCINSCKYRPTCPVVRTKFLLHCIIVDEKNHSYYPIQYSNEIPLIPEEIRAETTIVDTCYKDGCDMPLFYSRMFNDTYVNMLQIVERHSRFFVLSSAWMNMRTNCWKMDISVLKSNQNREFDSYYIQSNLF